MTIKWCASAELACQAYQDSCKLTASGALSRKTSSKWSWNAFFFFFQAFFVHHKQVKIRSILSLVGFFLFFFFAKHLYQSWCQETFWLIGTLIQPVHLSHAPFYKDTVLWGCIIYNLHCRSSLRWSSCSAMNVVLASQIESLCFCLYFKHPLQSSN